MRVGLLIGALGRGGTERQLTELALGLKACGHDVEVVAYCGSGALDASLESQNVAVRHTLGGSKGGKLRAVRSWMTQFRPEVMHGFMKRASSLAVLANLPRRPCRVVASDLSTASYGRRKPSLWGSVLLFSLADVVTTQTEMNRRNLERLAPWLRGKVRVIRNGVDTERFRPLATPSVPPTPFRFACVGSVYAVKNPLRVVEAMHLLSRRQAPLFRLDWYGRLGLRGDAAPSAEYFQATDLVRRYGLESMIQFHGEQGNIERAYQTAHSLVHVSVQEGIPNAVIEAMASGLPIVVSRVSDLPLIVETAQNGFVCDETRPESIATAMQQMLTLDPVARATMGRRSRELAIAWFGKERFIADYLDLYRSLLAPRSLHRCGT